MDDDLEYLTDEEDRRSRTRKDFAKILSKDDLSDFEMDALFLDE